VLKLCSHGALATASVCSERCNIIYLLNVDRTVSVAVPHFIDDRFITYLR
jgi:hypothetical protein